MPIIGTPTYAVPTWMVRRIRMFSWNNKGKKVFAAPVRLWILPIQLYLFYAERVIQGTSEAHST